MTTHLEPPPTPVLAEQPEPLPTHMLAGHSETTTALPLDEVRMLLTAAGLPTSEAELAVLAVRYPALRAGVDALYHPSAVRYADPALRFHADTRITDWS